MPRAIVRDDWGQDLEVRGTNPYLLRFLEVRGDRFDPHDLVTWIAQGRDGAPPKGPLQWREELVAQYAWAIPTDAALDCLARYAPLIEIGAGSGLWACLLRARAVDILAFDLIAGPPGPLQDARYLGTNVPLLHRWTDVQRGGPEQARRHPDRSLFLCWPPYRSPMARRALRLYSGSTVLYIGEWRGATADDHFHDMLDQHWEPCDDVALPVWWGMHDRLYVLKRRQ